MSLDTGIAVRYFTPGLHRYSVWEGSTTQCSILEKALELTYSNIIGTTLPGT